MQVKKLRERLKELILHPATPTECVSGFVVKAWDADSEQYEPVSGYVIDSVHRTIELTTCEDGYEINLGIPAHRPVMTAIEELIRAYMAEWFGWHGDSTWVDAPYETHERDSEGRVTGPAKWRAMRRFAQEAHEILQKSCTGKQ